MYRRNLERNRAIYELWERGLTVDKIASLTGVPRSTVGYYVRKFNRLAAEGKPIVLPQESKALRETSTLSETSQLVKEMAIKGIRTNTIKLLMAGEYEQVYHLLMDWKLIRDLESLVSVDTLDKATKSLPPESLLKLLQQTQSRIT